MQTEESLFPPALLSAFHLWHCQITLSLVPRALPPPAVLQPILWSPTPTQEGGTAGLHPPHPETALLTSPTPHLGTSFCLSSLFISFVFSVPAARTDPSATSCPPTACLAFLQPLPDSDTDPADCWLPSTPRLKIPRTLSYSQESCTSLSCISVPFNLSVGGG